MAYILQFTSSYTTGEKSPFVLDDYRVNGPVGPSDPTAAINKDLSVTGNTLATPLLIYGKHMPNWGENLQENFIHMLENFCDVTPPVYPTKGMKWFDSSNNRLMFYTGTSWASTDSVLVDTVAPVGGTFNVNPTGNGSYSYDIEINAGQLYFNSTSSQLMIYDGVNWISASGNYVAKSGDSMDSGANITFSGGGEILGLPATPSDPTAATSADYVDTHINDDMVHLTSSQNTWLDAITATSTEVNYLSGLTVNVQNGLDDKLNIDGSNIMTGNLDLGSFQINNLADPILSSDGLNLGFADLRYVLLSGSIMTGPLTLNGNPSNALEAVPKQYADLFLPLTGGIMLGEIFGLPNIPSADDAAVSKWYADNIIAGGGVASTVSFTPYGNISSNNVQNALEEIDDEKIAKAGDTMDGAANLTFSSGGEVLGLPSTPSTGSAAASKDYVDTVNTNPRNINRNIEISPGYVATNPGITPSYVVGNNNLWIFVNGAKWIEGISYGYSEVGTIGTVSTSITWNDAVPASAIIEYLVF